MKILKETKFTPPTALAKDLRPELFFDRIKDFENAVMRHVYEFFTPFAGPREFEGWFEGEYEYRPVPVEFSETEDGFLLKAEVPGFEEKDVEVHVEPWRVYVTGKLSETTPEPKKGKILYSERISKKIARWFELPAEIDPEKVKATLHKGVLEITLLKAQPAKRVPIQVKAA